MATPESPETAPLSVPPASGQFAIVGDLQRTSRLEIWRESNLDERARILAEIAARRPDFVGMLGDLVFRGSSRAHWRDFDESCGPLSDRAIPIFPILGNHEYWTSPGAGLENFFARFPALGGRHWYSIRYGPLALACLDSNLRRLRRRRWEEQLRWYRAELQICDEEPSTRGVLSLVHHPPYTNSTVTGDERHVQREIVPPFLAAAKTLGMISGHVHSYERFRRGGKTFLVAGGAAVLASGLQRPDGGGGIRMISTPGPRCGFSISCGCGWPRRVWRWRPSESQRARGSSR